MEKQRSRPKECGQHRKATFFNKVIGLSIGDSDDLLDLGFGTDHLREVLVAVCRPLLRHGADLAYSGNFCEYSFTRDLLSLIAAEQDSAAQQQMMQAGPPQWIGKLYNHSPWPGYYAIQVTDRAQFIDRCEFIEFDEAAAKIPEPERVGKVAEGISSPRIAYNTAVVMTALRRKMPAGLNGALGKTMRIHARIVIGGKTGERKAFSGILPGIYEEVLSALEWNQTRDAGSRAPIYILGGFGGAAGNLANCLLQPQNDPPRRELTMEFFEKNAAFQELQAAFDRFNTVDGRPRSRRSDQALAALRSLLEAGHGQLGDLLANGLSEKENRILLETTSRDDAARLILKGLAEKLPSASKS